MTQIVEARDLRVRSQAENGPCREWRRHLLAEGEVLGLLGESWVDFAVSAKLPDFRTAEIVERPLYT